ncbi:MULTISPECIES: ABC transporter substrate-binding protein [Agrobacterium]|jgi:iron complex transport system substrate-binding protein|uniref:ABC transporter substrate-binding protein n=1 Tax=Agrobacterium TaxID=357 RepID=UPI00098FDF47|nr:MULTISPECIES: ABC transporter substrate-binding protein [Agrobacterium]PNQ20580.1 ABC transporter substrate-binding protein [Rhizobium sp. YIC5082]MCZ7865328.1 ABC transporter substrate-binding protein [Agrobacterium salinitolerans]MCZ7885701.1 ABC transporter substrate-binding protein [Agrobacterium salinitolerans]MDA5627290.1 ABC transporter substrate-binding protein [Agrobacterium sp. ST15.16.055]MDA5636780.1 ABC transporter substrate-binding protein [Agrobacterium sp. ST15.13.013]
MRLNALRHLAVLAFSLLAMTAHAGEITDVAGRKVELDLPAKRIIVGEARQVHVIAALKGDKTFDTIVGWRDDLLKKDPDSYAAYVERFPQIEKLPRFGYVPQGDFSLETAITLSPDVITLNLEAEKSAKESGFEDKAAAAGIKVIYLDFRIDPEKNSEASVEILGKLFGAEERAKEFIAYRRAEIARVTDRLASVKDLKRPNVFIERAPGISGENNCCRTFGPVNFGAMVDLAGGQNIADGIIKTTFGDLNPEQLVIADPDQVIVTGSNWAAESDINQFVPVGRGADMVLSRERLANLMKRTPFPELKAVKEGNVHAVWHQFYGAPYEFFPIQQFAKWFHPDLFADLDPERNFEEFHRKFLPITYKPGYFASLDKGLNQ